MTTEKKAGVSSACSPAQTQEGLTKLQKGHSTGSGSPRGPTGKGTHTAWHLWAVGDPGNYWAGETQRKEVPERRRENQKAEPREAIRMTEKRKGISFLSARGKGRAGVSARLRGRRWRGAEKATPAISAAQTPCEFAFNADATHGPNSVLFAFLI